MPHAIPEPIELVNRYNKPIKQGKSNKPYADELATRDRTAWVSIDGKVLDKPIQIYRMWYRFLQLGLELEQNGIQIITKEQRVPLKIPKKDAYGHLRKSVVKHIKHSVKVNRRRYEGWNLDAIPTTSFDNWWKSHRHLFFDDSTVMVNSKDEWVDDPNYQHFRIDKRKRANDILTEVRNLLAQEKNWKVASTSKFPVTGSPNINTLVNRYNALVVKLSTNKSDKEIFTMGLLRETQRGMEGTFGEQDNQVSVYKLGANYGRAMRDLILPAKISLLSVCDGYFVTNPNKTYL
jgi:hypothetical protein